MTPALATLSTHALNVDGIPKLYIGIAITMTSLMLSSFVRLSETLAKAICCSVRSFSGVIQAVISAWFKCAILSFAKSRSITATSALVTNFDTNYCANSIELPFSAFNDDLINKTFFIAHSLILRYVMRLQFEILALTLDTHSIDEK